MKTKKRTEGEPVDPETGMALTPEEEAELAALAGEEVDPGATFLVENPGGVEPSVYALPEGYGPRDRYILLGGKRYEHVSEAADGSWVYRVMP